MLLQFINTYKNIAKIDHSINWIKKVNINFITKLTWFMSFSIFILIWKLRDKEDNQF